jgi:hypothetical protein
MRPRTTAFGSCDDAFDPFASASDLDLCAVAGERSSSDHGPRELAAKAASS